MRVGEIKQTIVNGNLTIKNVPHWYKEGDVFPDGEQTALSGETAYILAKIFRHMLENKLLEFDYNDFRDLV